MKKHSFFRKFERPVAKSKYIVSVKAKSVNWRNFLYFSTMALHPNHILKDLDGTAFLEEYAFSVIPGTGPYILEDKNIKNQESYTFERRKDYWDINSPFNRYKFNFDKIKDFFYKVTEVLTLFVAIAVLVGIIFGPETAFFGDVVKKFSNILKQKYKTGFQYFDIQIDDKKLTKLNAKDAKRNKAKILEYNKVKKAEIIGNEWIISLEKGEKVKSKILINASGPWINETLNKNIKIKSKKKIRLVKGSHIITKKLYKENVAFTFQNTDKRIIFVIPYKGKFSLIGTTEVEVKSPENKGISKKEITYLIRSVNNYLKKQIRTKDIVDTYSGIRPLIEDFNTASKVTRDYVFDLKIIKKLPLLNIYGGKLTTYRKLSEKVLFDLRKFLPKTKKGPWTHKKKLL